MKRLAVLIVAVLAMAMFSGCANLKELGVTKDIAAAGKVIDPDIPAEAHIVTRIDTWYGGEDLSGAILDSDYKLTVSADGRTWSAAPSDWPMKDDLNVIVCAAYQNEAGEWVGGKYEWNRANPSPRSWINIAKRYNGWVAPPEGTELTVWAASVDGKRVSTEATAIYK